MSKYARARVLLSTLLAAGALSTGTAWAVPIGGGGTPPDTITQTLTVTVVGLGQVTDTGVVLCSRTPPSAPSGSTTCPPQSYAEGSDAPLTPTGSGGHSFLGWSGACSGTGACTVTMDASKSVTATFGDITPPPPPNITSPGENQIVQTTAAASVPLSFAATSGDTFGFRCVVDGVNHGTCTNGHLMSGLTTGSHSAQVYARDAVSNESSAATRNFKVVVLPETTLGGTPAAGATVNSTATAFLPASPTGTTFQCSLNGGAWGSCGSLSPVEGANTVGVRAGVVFEGTTYYDQSPVVRSWTVDTAAPQTAITSDPPPAITSSHAIGFTYSGSDPSPGTALTFECRLDGAAFAACPAGYTSIPDGAHTFQVRAKDAAGNVDPSPAEQSWTVDSAAPNTTISSAPPSATSSRSAGFSYAGTDPSPGTALSYECKLDAEAYAACPVAPSYTSLADGEHTFTVRATDAAGNADPTPATHTWKVDTVAPDTAVASGPAAKTYAHDAAFTFLGSDPSPGTPLSFECKLDGGAFAACGSGPSYGGLADGLHAFSVRAKDAAGNLDPTPATYSWQVATDTDADGVDLALDCNDANAAIHPGATEVAGNDVDENCDGVKAPAASNPNGGAPGGGGTQASTVKATLTGKVKAKKLVITKAIFTGVPAGAALEVRCSGGGCPFKKRKVTASHGSADVTALLKKAKLRNGAVVELRAVVAGTTRIWRLTARGAKGPRRQQLVQTS
ncbi:MAG: large repetitive protein [Solirubrobacteraceae bacterium]|jgi:hypothetical protein|nr:large repetitive protein [Solirubrobacteraceae bacterium]